MACTVFPSSLKRLFRLGAAPVLLFSTCSYLFFDRGVTRFFQTLPAAFDQMMEILTRAGLSTGYLVASACLFLFYRFVRRQKVHANRALFVFLSLSLAGIGNSVLKFVMGRYRPKAFLEAGLYGFRFFETDHIATSFPSGHANTAGALMLCLALFYPGYRYIFFVGALLIAFTRVALCAHYLSDAVCGLYLGGLVAVWVGVEMEKRGLALVLEQDGRCARGER